MTLQTALQIKRAERRDQSGFTLMEGIAVMGVMTMVLLLVVQIFMVSYDAFAKQTARAENDSSAILIVRSISEMARGATEVMASQTVNGTAYASSADELVLKMPTVNDAGNVISGNFDYIAFYRDETDPDRIRYDLQAEAGSYRRTGNKLIGAHNAMLVFRYDNPDISQAKRVSVYLRNEATARRVTVDTEAWTSIFLRNR